VDLKVISKTSPLYDYWRSKQDDLDESNRLLKSNKNSPAKYLFEKEPYKWENLYQSIVREIIKGDNDSIRGLRILLDTISLEEKGKVLRSLADMKLLDADSLTKVVEVDSNEYPTKKNIIRFSKILFAIFTNPYGIELKRNTNHIYESSGRLINEVRKTLGRKSI